MTASSSFSPSRRLQLTPGILLDEIAEPNGGAAKNEHGLPVIKAVTVEIDEHRGEAVFEVVEIGRHASFPWFAFCAFYMEASQNAPVKVTLTDGTEEKVPAK